LKKEAGCLEAIVLNRIADPVTFVAADFRKRESRALLPRVHQVDLERTVRTIECADVDSPLVLPVAVAIDSHTTFRGRTTRLGHSGTDWSRLTADDEDHSHIRRMALDEAAAVLEPTFEFKKADAAQTSSDSGATDETPTSQGTSQSDDLPSDIAEIFKESGSSGWTRTSNPPVNSLTPVQHLVGSSVV
jgi:hypothetical protein